MCASGVCAEGKCLAALIPTGAPCPDYYSDDDCANESCARDSYPMGEPVCCLSGGYVYSNADGEFYCAGLPDGDPCDPLANGMCASGVCSEGSCVAQKLAAGEGCPDFDDNDFSTGYCALGAYPLGDPVCCVDGYVYSIGQDTLYCTGIQGTNAECDANELCSSGVCSDGLCADAT
jgi:hypothetical protein